MGYTVLDRWRTWKSFFATLTSAIPENESVDEYSPIEILNIPTGDQFVSFVWNKKFQFFCQEFKMKFWGQVSSFQILLLLLPIQNFDIRSFDPPSWLLLQVRTDLSHQSFGFQQGFLYSLWHKLWEHCTKDVHKDLVRVEENWHLESVLNTVYGLPTRHLMERWVTYELTTYWILMRDFWRRGKWGCLVDIGKSFQNVLLGNLVCRPSFTSADQSAGVPAETRVAPLWNWLTERYHAPQEIVPAETGWQKILYLLSRTRLSWSNYDILAFATAGQALSRGLDIGLEHVKSSTIFQWCLQNSKTAGQGCWAKRLQSFKFQHFLISIYMGAKLRGPSVCFTCLRI